MDAQKMNARNWRPAGPKRLRKSHDWKQFKPTDQQLQKWNKTLSDVGLSMHSGNDHHLLYYTSNEEELDSFQIVDTHVGENGGRVGERYKLGYRRSLPRACQQCGKSFFSKHEDAKFCHQRCAKQAIRTVPFDRYCQGCAKPLKIKRRGKKYCSPKCRLGIFRMKRLCTSILR